MDTESEPSPGMTNGELAPLDTHQSVYREHLLEHLLTGKLLQYAWLHRRAELEVSKPELDRTGCDIVLEANGITRHIQLKSSALTAKTDCQNIHIALMRKPSGCVVWIYFNQETLELGPFLIFAGRPGEPLPSLDGMPIAKHSKGNATGFKKERPNIRKLHKRDFRRLETVQELYQALFGTH